jgi:hypothetical protein
MTVGGLTRLAGCVLLACAPGAKAAERAKAEVACAPTAAPLAYDCTIKLADTRSDKPITGVEVTLGADMPSMPMAHNVRPAKTIAGPEPGVYRARLQLEMHGDWALRIDLSGRIRDRIVKTMRFEARPGGAPGHKHH